MTLTFLFFLHHLLLQHFHLTLVLNPVQRVSLKESSSVGHSLRLALDHRFLLRFLFIRRLALLEQGCSQLFLPAHLLLLQSIDTLWIWNGTVASILLVLLFFTYWFCFQRTCAWFFDRLRTLIVNWSVWIREINVVIGTFWIRARTRPIIFICHLVYETLIIFVLLLPFIRIQ